MKTFYILNTELKAYEIVQFHYDITEVYDGTVDAFHIWDRSSSESATESATSSSVEGEAGTKEEVEGEEEAGEVEEAEEVEAEETPRHNIKTQEELLRTTQLVYSCQDGIMVPRLREPRQLYGLNAHEFGPQQVARWPSDIQVAVERIKHIEYEPPVPEPFYKPTGREPTPMAQSHEDGGRTVYEYEPNIGSFFMRSRVNGSRGSCVQAIPESDSDKTLIFESRFESGNLGRVVQVGEYEYELWLRRDLYTTKHMQWFYFRVSNTHPNVKYRFTIVNLIKPDSLYNQGMKPLMYSEKNAAEKKIGWTRHGEDIKYYRNNIKYTSGKQERYYYSLTWTCQLPHKGDHVYYTHCYPYSYSDLQDYLSDIVTDPVKSKICKQRVLCRTLAGNMVYLLTITSPTKNTCNNERRKAVVITARIHPGESNSSWMMKGFLDYLVGNSADAKLLRDNFIFKIVPMLNPDGVIVGNYRCSLAGRDLNRSYKTMLKDSFPPVWHTKVMIKKLTEEREVVVYVDLHGHSRKQNVFIYGCENRGTPSRRLRERIFPVMLGKNAPTKFSYESCKFKIQKNKEGTGRVVMWNMGIMNSYTMEATFCGSSLGDKKGLHFSVRDFEAMGYHFCDTLLDYCDPDNSKAINILMALEDRLKNEILQRLRLHEDSDVKDINDINLDLYYTSGMESSDGGSDSSVSDGLPVHLQYMTDKFPPKKKRLRSKKDRDKNKTQLTKDPLKKSHVIPASTVTSERRPEVVRAKPIRYSSAKRPRSKEERTAFVVGVPVYTLERMDTRMKKISTKQSKVPKDTDLEPRQMDPSYLAGLTDVYLQNGKLPPDVDKEIPHFRYTAGPVGDRGNTCPIHDPTYTVQNGNSHLQQHRYPDTLDETPPCQRGYTKSSSGDTSNSIVSRQTNQDMEYLHKPLKQHPRPFEESQLQERLNECVNRGRTRQSMPRTTSASSYGSRQQMSSRQSSAPHGPNITRSGSDGTSEIAAAMAGKLETRRSPVTRATESSSKNMYWSQSFTYGSRQTSQSSAKKSPHAKVAQSTSEIFHAPEATPITMQGPIPQSHPSGSSSVSSGVHPQPLQDPCPTIIPTSPSVELNNTMKSFNEIRQSLMDPRKRKKLSPTTGQFVDHFVKKTVAEVEDITAEIDKKSQQDNKASAAPPIPSTPRSSTRFQLQPKGARTKHGGYLAGHMMETSSLTTYLSNGRTRKSSLGLPSSYRPTSSRGAPSSYGEASGGQIDPEFTPIINNARTLSVQLQGTNLYQTTETRRFTKEQIEQGLHQGYARMDEGGSWTSSSDDKDRALPRRPSTEPASTGPITRSNITELEASKPQSSVGCGPTKISLMISRDHQEQHSGQFHAHSLTRPVNRPPLLRNMPKRL